MPTSILETIKKMLGLGKEYTAFDTDIIVFINSAMMELQQLGVGPKSGLTVTGYDETWSDLITDGSMIESVKTYIYLSVKMVFDPPANSFVMTSMEKQKDRLEWRIREQAEFYPGDGSRLGYYQSMFADEDDDYDNQPEEPLWPKRIID